MFRWYGPAAGGTILTTKANGNVVPLHDRLPVIHDLRHSFASGGLLVGEGLSMIGKLPGHTQVQTTARYAHLANDPVESAANRIASCIT